MKLEQLLNQHLESPKTENYWFVRTDKGSNFDAFTNFDFIGIGWNTITVENLKKLTVNEIKSRIAIIEDLDLGTSKGKSKATAIYNKILRFSKLKKGDVIISPSYKAHEFAFGIIQDDVMYSSVENEDLCQYYKRRKVKWIKKKHFSNLDPVFYQIKTTRHAISDIKKYASFIDKEINTMYIKDNAGHYVIDIKSHEDINTQALLAFIKTTNELTSIINEKLNFDESIDDGSIKLNLQSPGKVEFKIPGGKTVICLAALLSVYSCRDEPITESTPVELQHIANEHPELIEDFRESMRVLDIDSKKINMNN